VTKLRVITSPEFVTLADEAGVNIPIEQDPIWDKYEEYYQKRQRRSVFFAWGDRAIVSLRDYKLRNKSILWARSGPIWFTPPTPTEENALADALMEYARSTSAIAVRLHAKSVHPKAVPTFYDVAYDTTVFVDLDKPEEQVLADMRKRGRRDVRKAMRSDIEVREVPLGVFQDRLDDFYEVMGITAKRDSFGALPKERMAAMMEVLGKAGRQRIFEAHNNGHLVAWASFITTGDHAQYYTAATDTTDREGAADLVLWEAMKALRNDGIKQLDLMGIGSDLAPALNSLTTFKKKFAPEPETVAPARDYPVRLGYQIMVIERRGLRWLRQKLQATKSRGDS